MEGNISETRIPWEGLKGKDKYWSVRNYMEELGFPVRDTAQDKEPDCVKKKYVLLIDGTSVHVRDHYFHIFCGEKAASAVSRAIGVKPEPDNIPSKQDSGVRPFVFHKINDEQLVRALNSLLNSKNEADSIKNPSSRYSSIPNEDLAYCEAAEVKGVDGKEKERIISARVNQSVIRTNAIRKYGCRCVLCGLRTKELLVASHIKAWSESTDSEKGDPDNVLLLCPNHDAVFDKHLITFDDDGNIQISSQLDEHERAMLNLRPSIKITMNDNMRRYMEYHRKKWLDH